MTDPRTEEVLKPTDSNPLGCVKDAAGKVWIDADAPTPPGWRRSMQRWDVDQIEPLPYTFRGRVNDAGGGYVTIYVDSDTPDYPQIGASVNVEVLP